jgi:hypothetical protein
MLSDLQRESSSSPVVFPDTNIFLHYTFFPEIPWDTIVGSAQVTLGISPVTVSEIDSQKYSGSSARIRDRARKITKRLGELVDSGGLLRPNVHMEFVDHEPVDFDRYQLIRSSQDDQLLATILQYQEKYPTRKILLVTNDIGLKIKAKARGIRTLALPESYLLTEPDPNEKKIKELERKVVELQSQAPLLKLECGDRADRVEIQRPSAFLDESTFVEQGMQQIKRNYSKLGLPSNSMNGLANAFVNVMSSESIRDYNISLDEFFEKYREYLSSCYRIKEIRSRAVKIDLNVKNFGTGTALDVKVFVRFPLIVELKTDTKWQRLPRKPLPPEKPEPGFFWPPRDFSSLIARPYIPPSINIPEMLAAPRIIWRGVERGERSWTVFFEVSKLNHGYSEASPRDIYVVFPSVDSFSSFKFEYELTAGNLPEKVNGFLHLIVKD